MTARTAVASPSRSPSPGSSSTRRAARRSSASGASPSSRRVARLEPHDHVGGVRQQRLRVPRRLVGRDDDQRPRADVVRLVGRRHRLEVGELGADALAERQRPDDQRHVQTDGGELEQLPAVARPEDHGGPLAHDVPGGRELLAQAVVGRMRDRRVREVRAPVAVVPGGADRQRLAPEALLEQLVDVEGGQLERGDGARRARVGLQEDVAAARAVERPELVRLDARAPQQVLEKRCRPLRIGEPRAPRVDDRDEDLLPVVEALRAAPPSPPAARASGATAASSLLRRVTGRLRARARRTQR